MKRFLILGIFALLTCSVDANASSLAVSTNGMNDLNQISVCAASKKPKVVIRDDRVIIIHDDGTTIVVDKDGETVVVPSRP